MEEEKEENILHLLYILHILQNVSNPYLSAFSGTSVSKEEIRNKNSLQHTISQV